MAKDFGDWVNSLAGSIEDASTFSKDIKSTEARTLRDYRKILFRQTEALHGENLKTDQDVCDFMKDYVNRLFGNDGLINAFENAISDEEHVEWFEEFKEWIMK